MVEGAQEVRVGVEQVLGLVPMAHQELSIPVVVAVALEVKITHLVEVAQALSYSKYPVYTRPQCQPV